MLRSSSTLFSNINKFPVLEPTDTSCNDMTEIANNVNILNGINTKRLSTSMDITRRLSVSTDTARRLSATTTDTTARRLSATTTDTTARRLSGNTMDTVEILTAPEMRARPSIINGLLLEKYINNKINTYFDKIYILNVDIRLDHWLNIKKILNYHEIYNYKRYSIPHNSLNKCPPTVLKNILLDALKNKYKSILLLEDGILLHNHFNKQFNKYITKINTEWSLIQLSENYNCMALGIHSNIFAELIELTNNNLVIDCFKKIKNKNIHQITPALVISKKDTHANRKIRNFSSKIPYINETISVIMIYHNSVDNINFENSIQSLIDQDILNLYPRIKLEIVIINNIPMQDPSHIKNLLNPQYLSEHNNYSRIQFKIYKCPEIFDLATCYNLGIGLSNGYYITFQDQSFVSMENRLTQQYHDINNYNVDISIATDHDVFIPETLFYNRLIVNKLGYIEHNLNTYLHKLLLKYHCCKTTNIIKWFSAAATSVSTTSTHHPIHKRVKYYPFLDNPNHTLIQVTADK